MDMDDDLSISTIADYYPSNEFKKISYSFERRYYDEIITRLRLQAIEKYQYGTPANKNPIKLEEEEGTMNVVAYNTHGT